MDESGRIIIDEHLPHEFLATEEDHTNIDEDGQLEQDQQWSQQQIHGTDLLSDFGKDEEMEEQDPILSVNQLDTCTNYLLVRH